MNSHLILPICAKPNHAERNSPLSYFPPGARRRGVPPPHSLAVHLAFSLALLHLLSSPSWFLCATLTKSCMWISFLFIADKFAIDSQAKSEFLWLGTLVCAGMYPQWAWYPQVKKICPPSLMKHIELICLLMITHWTHGEVLFKSASTNVPCSVSPTSNPLLADALQRAQVGRDHNIEKKLWAWFVYICIIDANCRP